MSVVRALRLTTSSPQERGDAHGCTVVIDGEMQSAVGGEFGAVPAAEVEERARGLCALHGEPAQGEVGSGALPRLYSEMDFVTLSACDRQQVELR